MTIPKDTQDHIDARIRRIQGRRRGDAQELRSHILDAAPRSIPEADAAFDALGDEHTIREAFFPARPRRRLGTLEFVSIGVAVALLLLAGLMDNGEASCTVTGPGTCNVSSTGQVADTALLVSAPLIAAAILRWWLAPVALLPAAALVFFTFMRLRATDSVGTDATLAGLELAASLVTLAVVVRHIILERRATA